MSARWVAWVAVVGLLGCRDADAERLARARAQYARLIEQRERPGSPGFDRVLAELDAVAPSSSSHPDAQALARRIRAARMHVRTPLALGSKGTRHPALEAQLKACARMAELAGADGGASREALVALEACRQAAEKLELKLSHGDEHGGEGHPGH